MNLPSDIDPNEFDDHFRLTPPLWTDAVRELCIKHEIEFENFRAFEDGSNLIAEISGRYVFKIFPPFHRNQWESEWLVLQHLWKHGLRLPIPELIAHGERGDGWTYVIISKLPGVTLESIWPELKEEEKASLLHSIGQMMAQVHSLPMTGLENLDPQWNEFLDAQVEKCRTRHQRLGMKPWFLDSVDGFVKEHLPLIPKEKPVVLTGEYTPFNLLADGGPGAWRISGMIDFGDSMIGFREYDLLGPALFSAEGNERLVRSLMDGYGYESSLLSKQLATRLTLLAVLHRYSNLKFQIRIPGWLEKVKTFGELRDLLFPFVN